MEDRREGEENEGREQLTPLQQTNCFPRRPLSNYSTNDYQVIIIILFK